MLLPFVCSVPRHNSSLLLSLSQSLRRSLHPVVPPSPAPKTDSLKGSSISHPSSQSASDLDEPTNGVEARFLCLRKGKQRVHPQGPEMLLQLHAHVSTAV